jgi:hypothetical protein
METTERIVEAYCRYIKRWLTIPNLRCGGQYEVDLLAVDLSAAGGTKRYHIECSVSISGSFSRLTARPFSTEQLKDRIKAPEQRRTMGFYLQRKFEPEEVALKLSEYGFEKGSYSKIIVSWGWTADALQLAKDADVTLWDFRDIIREIADSHKDQDKYFADDTLRTLQLYSKAVDSTKRRPKP